MWCVSLCVCECVLSVHVCLCGVCMACVCVMWCEWVGVC